jgi:hypothetical protein
MQVLVPSYKKLLENLQFEILPGISIMQHDSLRESVGCVSA